MNLKDSASQALAYCMLLLACVGAWTGCRSTKSDTSYYSGATGPIVSGTQSDSATWAGAPTRESGMDDGTNVTQGQISIPLFEETLVVGTRSVESGGVRLKKEIITETVSYPVQIRRETLTVEREGVPTAEPATGATGQLWTPFEPGEIVVRLHSEEPVVETRIISSGRIVVQTRTNAEQQTVQGDVRRERIDVQKLGDGTNVVVSENIQREPAEAVGSPPQDTQTLEGEGSIQQQQTTPEEWEAEPFPRAQPDGRMTFPELHKSQEPR